MGIDRDKSPWEAAGLRSRAEERVSDQMRAGPEHRTADETQRLLHELQVHQIELEMQNEELRRSRDEVEELLERVTDLYDFAPVGYLTLDREGTIRGANLTATRLFGIERSRLIGRHFGQLLAPTERPAFSDFLDTVFADHGREVCEVALRSESGPPLIVEIAASSTPSRQECRLAMLDVTARRQAEGALRESEDQLFRLAEMAVDAIVMLDDAGTVTFCNPAAEGMFDYPPGALVGRSFQGLFVPEPLVGATEQGFARFTEDGCGPARRPTREVVGLRRDGREFPLELSVSGLKLKETWHAIAILRDTTERKSLEAQLLQAQKMETIGLLAGGIAHDFNNILNVIMGYGSLFELRMRSDDPLRSNLGQIMAAAERGANLTRSLLSFARKQAINPRTTRLQDIISRVRAFLVRVIGEEIRFETGCSDEDLVVTVDEGQIEQVLTNLATNAKAAMPGGGTLTIACSSVEIDADFIRLHGFGRPGRFALVSVTDTGVGMERETIRRIFEPFFTTKTPGQGTGLGLSIAYGIVKQHDGFIDVASEPGMGTTFRIYLPLATAAVGPQERATESAVQGGTETVLLAEDDDAVRALTQRVLTQMGYRVIATRDGASAVAAFAEHRDSVQLLLFDVIMPNKNGWEAWTEIREHSPRMRVLLMSGYTADIINRDDLDVGIGFIRKPFTTMELTSKVRETLDMEGPRRARAV